MNHKFPGSIRALFSRSVSWFLPLSVGALSSCGVDQYAFAPTKFAQTNPPATGCTVGTSVKKLRIYVMVDNSGSTADTDPNQSYRVETLQRFLAQYGSKENLTYGFGYFADSASLFDMSLNRFVAKTANAPFGTAAQIGLALNTYHGTPPVGGTGYSSAFDALRSAVTRDQSAGIVQDYAIIFMSDGQPSDLSGDIPQKLIGLVSRLQSTAQSNGKSRLVLSTVYFGDKDDSESIQNLQRMATQGGGPFVDTNQLGGAGLVIDDLISVPGC